MKSSLLIVLILIGATSASLLGGNSTVFFGNGTVHCDLPNKWWWCFQVTVYETDSPFTDDKIDFFGTKCTRDPSYNYKLSGTQNGDGGFWNNFYELDFYIIHNCTTHGAKMRQIRRNTQYAPSSALFVEIKQWNSSITNLGLETTEFF
ncbi:unnamed protein product [Caenorhabditis brenneri]